MNNNFCFYLPFEFLNAILGTELFINAMEQRGKVGCNV